MTDFFFKANYKSANKRLFCKKKAVKKQLRIRNKKAFYLSSAAEKYSDCVGDSFKVVLLDEEFPMRIKTELLKDKSDSNEILNSPCSSSEI